MSSGVLCAADLVGSDVYDGLDPQDRHICGPHSYLLGQLRRVVDADQVGMCPRVVVDIRGTKVLISGFTNSLTVRVVSHGDDDD